MKRYIALLRGINISGRNKIPMPELKAYLTELGYSGVQTYLNSGNVAFSVDGENENTLSVTIRDMIQKRFGPDIPVYVILQEKLEEILSKAPDWWGTSDKGRYDNLIFVLSPATAESIAEKIGEPTMELEQIRICDNTIFWSFDRTNYAKANWWKKTAAKGIGELLTIRTANTLRKLLQMTGIERTVG